MSLVGDDRSLVAVATNSEKARIFDRHTLNCEILSGHTGKPHVLQSFLCSNYVV